MTPKIFVFTAGDRAARRHLADSIEHPIPDETVFANFAEAHHEELERVREEGGGFYAWGALPGPGNRRTWEAINCRQKGRRRDTELSRASRFFLQNDAFMEWAMLVSNQRPLPCEGSTMVCWSFLEFAKYLQTAEFLH